MQSQSRILLAIDYGTKITGLALMKEGDLPYPIAHGKIAYKNDENLFLKIEEIVKEDAITTIVIGLPFLTDGSETKMTRRVRQFYFLVNKRLVDIDVHTQDETLSSFEAKDRMKNSAIYNFKVDLTKIDELAAVIILEEFLNRT